MRGLRAISHSLSQLVDALPPSELPRVMNCAMELIKKDYPREPMIQEAVERYRDAGIPNAELSVALARESELCDREYIRLEESGQSEASQAKYRAMCTLDGLSRLLRANELSLEVVDDVIYDLGCGAANTDDFGRALEKLLRV